MHSGFAYAHDALGRRTQVEKSGGLYSSYGSGSTVLKTLWAYDDRSQLTAEDTKQGTTSNSLPGRTDAYAYDELGNRLTTVHNSTSSTYTPDSLNRYTQRQVPSSYDVAGASNASIVTVQDSASSGSPLRTAARHNDYYFDGYPLTNTSTAVATALDVSLGGTPSSVSAWVPKTPEVFSYDDDGNLLSDGLWDYAYDAENRLITMQTRTSLSPSILPNASARRLEFKYDYLGRRIRKTVYAGYSGTGFTTTQSDTKFVYEGWNLIAELDALASSALSKSYAWGLDWSGSLQGAGGVGGLLQLKQGTATYAVAYDGNGNVMGLVARSTGVLDTGYEYDAFGKTLRANGTMAAINPFRFSTKYTDSETGLVYYGLRYYSPSMGRFVCRDPIEESGGKNLYAFLHNNAVNSVDYLGWHSVDDDVWYPPAFRVTAPRESFPGFSPSGSLYWYGSSGSFWLGGTHIEGVPTVDNPVDPVTPLSQGPTSQPLLPVEPIAPPKVDIAITPLAPVVPTLPTITPQAPNLPAPPPSPVMDWYHTPTQNYWNEVGRFAFGYFVAAPWQIASAANPLAVAGALDNWHNNADVIVDGAIETLRNPGTAISNYAGGLVNSPYAGEQWFNLTTTMMSAGQGLTMATTREGFLFGSVRITAPFDIPVQRFGVMKIGGNGFWAPPIGRNSFINRAFSAITPEMNDLSVYTRGYIPRGTQFNFGLTGPQNPWFRYPGFNFQFTLPNKSVINQVTRAR